MARKVVEAEETKVYSKEALCDLVDIYGEKKAEFNKLKAETDAQNANIKTMMKELLEANKEGKRSFDGSIYTATLSITDKSTMNEDKLITWLKKNKLAKGIIKKKEYVDSNALESAIYNGIITQEQLIDMESCKDLSQSEVLRISKRKKGE